MKLKFVDSLLAAVNTKDEAGIRTAIARMLDEAREEEEEKRKEDEEAKDKARDAATVKLVNDAVATAVKDAISAAFKARDEEAAAEKKKAEDAESEKAKKEEDEELEEELEEESGSKDARKAKDSALLVESFDNVKMNAEIVHPGVQIPTFDAAADPKKTFRDCHCGLRRKALTGALGDTGTAAMITAVRGRVVDAAEIGKMPCGQVRTLFNGVAAMKRAANNSATTRDGFRAAAVETQTTDQKTPTQRFVDQAAERRKNRFK